SRRKYRQLKMVAGVHSIYRPADGYESVARLSAARAGEKTAPMHSSRHIPRVAALRALPGLPTRRRL
ncbi:hypothetical protein, partial [Klebsiella michiganensis]|uniref:hypothetical protein n=1 Tax=Klebsiella michiganensis TaxID=1134687 RepID=UPI001CA4A54A